MIKKKKKKNFHYTKNTRELLDLLKVNNNNEKSTVKFKFILFY